MKANILSVLLLVLCLYSCTSDSVEVRTLSIDGKQYQVTCHTRLNAQMEYLLLRESAKASANAFLQTQSGLAPTVFSLSELRSFLASGNLEELGKVKTLRQPDNTLVRYVVKGATNVFVLNEKGAIDFFEYKGSVSDLADPSGSWLANAPSTGPAPGTGTDIGTEQTYQNRLCRQGCWNEYQACLARNPGAVHKLCKTALENCGRECNRYYP